MTYSIGDKVLVSGIIASVIQSKDGVKYQVEFGSEWVTVVVPEALVQVVPKTVEPWPINPCKNTTGKHEWYTTKAPEPPNSGWYEERCSICGITQVFDTSD